MKECQIAVVKAGQKRTIAGCSRDDTKISGIRLKAKTRVLVDVQSVKPIIVPEDMLFILNDLQDATYDNRIWGGL